MTAKPSAVPISAAAWLLLQSIAPHPAFAVAPPPPSESSGSVVAPRTRALLERYCFECHNEDKHKGGLDLEKLSPDLENKANRTVWESVFERLHDASMPPKKAEQPPAADKHSALLGLRSVLHAASLREQQKEGRVAFRRLSRAQYQDTLRDLLHLPALEILEALPEESPVAGFDNVSAAQTLSGTHLVRYQQAIDRALSAAIPSRPVPPIRLSVTGREWMENQGKKASFEAWKCWLKGDALVIPSKLYRPGTTVAAPPAPTDGLYRIRVTGYGLNTGGNSFPVTFNTMQTQQLAYGKDLDWRDLPADTAGTVEVELPLQQGQIVDILGWTLPTRDWVKFKHKDLPADQWTGPSLALERLEVEGPLDTWPPQSYQVLFGDLPLQTDAERTAAAQNKPAPDLRKRTAEQWMQDPLRPRSEAPRDDARRLLSAFIPRAFRRPVPPELSEHYVSIALRLLEAGIAFDEALLETYKSVLCSPHFLFFVEQPGRLDPHAVASRLSYFLWNSLPDEALLAAAADGSLQQPGVLHAQVERMLSHPKARRFSQQFAGQWLELHKIDATTPDMKLYPEFDRILMESSARETELFFKEILSENRSVLEFVQSDWTFLNRRLAQHYGISTPEPLGYELQKVALPKDSHRGGVITHASILKVTADGARTSPILRGKWMCERILGVEPPPPPKDVPAIEPDTRGTTTIRQQLAKHRNTEACASCHTLIDPPGFALESFDVIGGWRDFYRTTAPSKSVPLRNYPERRVLRGPDVEVGDRMPDGRPFADIEEYKRLLLEDPDALARNLVKRVLLYSTGGKLQFADREVVDALVARIRSADYGFRTLIHEAVQSRVFLHK
jgi:hypothetical protein